MTGVDKLLGQEDQLKDLKDHINLLKHECLDMEKIKKENGEQLDRFTNSDVYGPKIKSSIQELKLWKDKYERLMQKFETDDDVDSKK